MMIYALHGFLGLPSDWNCFQRQFHAVDIFQLDYPLEEWGHAFNATVSEKSILMGYSLGARLGMHALLANPSQWKAAIFISGNPGLKNVEETKNRLKFDEKWSQAFLQDPWKELMQKWDSLDVFGGISNPLCRYETDFSRNVLAKSLIQWSVSKQEDLSLKLRELDQPILWLAGELDRKYAQLAHQMIFKHPLSQMIIVPGAAHRVPWEKPAFFENCVMKFIETIT